MNRFISVVVRVDNDTIEGTSMRTIIPVDCITGVYEIEGEMLIHFLNKDTDQVEQMPVLESFTDLYMMLIQ